MRKILSLRGEALAKVMSHTSPKAGQRARYGDKKGVFPKPSKPMVYPAISDFRSKTGIPFRKQPIGARQPQWSYDPDSATAREERVAMLSDGECKATYKSHPSSYARLDKAKHAKALAQLDLIEAAKAKARRALKG